MKYSYLMCRVIGHSLKYSNWFAGGRRCTTCKEWIVGLTKKELKK